MTKRQMAGLAAGTGAGLLLAGLALSGCIRNYIFERLTPMPLPTAEPIDVIGGPSATACAGCHTEIYDEWKGSRMGQAWTNVAFQADFAEEHELYYCRNCHTPLQNQMPEITTGIAQMKPYVQGKSEPNPDYDEALRNEGVTCVVCHLRDGAMVGPHVVEAAPHPVLHDPDMASAKGCQSCHQMPILPFSNLERSLADTHVEWEAWKAITGRDASCVDCHMPIVVRPLVNGGTPRPSRKHTFVGGWDDETVQSALTMLAPEPWVQGIKVQIENQAGHRFPTADPARAIQVTATVLGEDGKTIATTDNWIERVVRKPARDISDNTLLPGEKRELHFHFRHDELSRAAEIRVTAIYYRFKNLPHAGAAVAAEDPSKLTVQLASRSIDWPPPLEVIEVE